MSDSFERRRFTRAPLPFRVTVRFGEKTIEANPGTDVSARGIAVMVDEELPLGAHCEVLIHLSPSIWIETRCTVRRSSPGDLAFEIDSIEMEAFELLRNVVKHNSDTPDIVEREFCAHLGLAKG